MEEMKRLIDEFCMSEYGSHADFSNPEAVGLAYTTVNETETTWNNVQVNADLVHLKIVSLYDDVVKETEQFDSVEEMCHALASMTFEDLISFCFYV